LIFTPICNINNSFYSFSDADIDGSIDCLTFDNAVIKHTLFLIEKGPWKNNPFQFAWNKSSDCLGSSNSNPWNLSKNNCFETNSFNVIGNVDYVHDGFYDFAYLLNISKNEFIDLGSYQSQFKGDKNNLLHPLPILANSEYNPTGNGDTSSHSLRGSWKNDCFAVVFNLSNIPLSFTDITEKCSFFLDKSKNNVLTIKANRKKLDNPFDKSFLDFISNSPSVVSISSLKSHNEVSNALKNNDQLWINFFKANGEKVSRLATLDKHFVSKSKPSSNNNKYLWFIDVNENKLKKIIFDNFISLETA